MLVFVVDQCNIKLPFFLMGLCVEFCGCWLGGELLANKMDNITSDTMHPTKL